jgi:hypothetical protein
MMRILNQTAFHIVGGCFLFVTVLLLSCDPPQAPAVERPKANDSLDLTSYCVIRLEQEEVEITYKDTLIHCLSFAQVDSAITDFGGAALDGNVALSWEGNVLYGRVDTLFDLLKENGIVNYRNLNNAVQ